MDRTKKWRCRQNQPPKKLQTFKRENASQEKKLPRGCAEKNRMEKVKKRQKTSQPDQEKKGTAG